MNWAESIDLYCERTDASFGSEPLNALTNLAFVAVALWLVRRYGRTAPRDARGLIGLIAAVGLGSLVFHTVATRWAALLDVGFIAVFVLAYFQRFQRHVLGGTDAAAWRGLGVFLVLAAGFAVLLRWGPPWSLNGSEIYLPPFALLGYCAWQARRRDLAAGRWLMAASGLFLFSLACRVIDQALCPLWPWGTHFGWHLGNAAVLACCMEGLLRHLPGGAADQA